jgi:hypothetical protein
MMTLISFFGGAAFRLIFGAIIDLLNKKQDHDHEMQLQRLQSELEAGRHARDLERIRLQSDLKVSEVKVMADAAEQATMTNAFLEAVKSTSVRTGIAWVDAWNQSIRPAGATIALTIWVFTMIAAGLVLSDFDRDLIAAFIGVFIGDRVHTKIR